MAYRVVEITHPAELHVKQGQLVVEQKEGTASIPLEDISLLIAQGPGIRLSTMAQTMIAKHNVMLILMDTNHLPAALSIPMVANTRQARVTARQAALTKSDANRIWKAIVTRKIENQARALSILGLDGAEQVFSYAQNIAPGDPENLEGQAAKVYFQYLRPGLNRREQCPFNSALNYGYAIVRAAIARSLVMAGFVPALGIHHHNQLNAFNLADDMIEPFRPCVDLLVANMECEAERLDSSQRKQLREVLEHAMHYRNRKIQVQSAIEESVSSLQNLMQTGEFEALELPIVMAPEKLPSIRE